MLKLDAVLGQRDARWSNILLGYNTSTFTIGSHGCLITCLSMLTGRTPDITNQILKDNGGYVSGGGLFIWSACSYLGIKQTYCSPKWDGPVTDFGITKAKELIDAGFPLLAEVDFNPATIGEDMHFLLVLGYDGDNFVMADPWTGTIAPMDVYGGFKRAVIQYRTYDKPFPKATAPVDLQAEYDKCRVARDAHWNDLMAIRDALRIGGEYSLTVVLAEIAKLITYEDKVREQEKQLAAVQSQAHQMESELTAKTAELKKLQDSIGEMQKTVDATIADNQMLQKAIRDLKQASAVAQLTGWKKRLYDWLMKGGR